MKLYEIAEQLRQLSEMDEIPPEQLQDTLDFLTCEFDDKAHQIAIVIHEMVADSDLLKNEIQRLTEKKRMLDAKQESLKDYLRYNMEVNGVTKVKGKLLTITLGAPSKIVIVPDADKLPAEFVRTKVEAEKALIKSALESGQEIDGCSIAFGKSKLIIK
jgi:hypothetical protein